MGRRSGPEMRLVERPIVDYANSRKVPHKKLSGFGSNHWPDRCFFVPGGKPLIMEMKAPGKTVEPGSAQEAKINQLRNLGYEVHVINNKDTGIRLLAERLDARPVPAKGGEVGAGTRGKRPASRSRAR